MSNVRGMSTEGGKDTELLEDIYLLRLYQKVGSREKTRGLVIVFLRMTCTGEFQSVRRVERT